MIIFCTYVLTRKELHAFKVMSLVLLCKLIRLKSHAYGMTNTFTGIITIHNCEATRKFTMPYLLSNFRAVLSNS